MSKLALITLCACALLGCANDPPWAGFYVGTGSATRTVCGGGALEPVSGPASIEIVETEDGIMIDGMCDIPLRETSPTTAEALPAECDVDLSTGVRAHVAYQAGTATLDGDSLTLELRADVRATGSCTEEVFTFTGTRLR